MDNDSLAAVGLAERHGESPDSTAGQEPPRRRRTGLIVAAIGAAGALAAGVAVAMTMSGDGTEVAATSTSRTTPATTETTAPVLAFTAPTTPPATTAPSATTPTTARAATDPPAPTTPAPRTAPAPTAAAAVAPACVAIPAGATTLAPGCYIESASNGDFFGFGITPQPPSGSAITISRGQVWKGLMIYGTPTATGATVQADLTNDSTQTMQFPSGISIEVHLTATGASPVTVTLSDASVRTLAPGAHVQLIQGTPLSSPGTYYVGGTTTFTVR